MATVEKAEARADVEVVESDGVEAVRVLHPEQPSQKKSKGAPKGWHEDQAEALFEYRVSGRPGVYLDQSRDQEHDIAPELGVAPHPELANPEPPDILAPGIGEEAPRRVVGSRSIEERNEFAKENPDGADEEARQREKALLAGATPDVQFVISVDSPEEAREKANAAAAPDPNRARTQKKDPNS